MRHLVCNGRACYAAPCFAPNSSSLRVANGWRAGGGLDVATHPQHCCRHHARSSVLLSLPRPVSTAVVATAVVAAAVVAAAVVAAAVAVTT